MNKTRQKVLIYEQTVKNIVQYIQEHNLGMGDKLPPERTLAKLLNVSRSCVREALLILSANNYIVIKRSSGAYINMPSLPEKFLMFEEETDEINLKDLQQILEARILLETYAIKQAAKIITNEQLLELYEKEDEAYEAILEESRQGIKPFGHPVIVLEHMLVQIQPNPYITELHRNICALWREHLDAYNLVTMPPAKRHRDHLAILKAVSEKNDARIARYISTHLNDTYDNISLMLQELKEESKKNS